MIHTIELTCQIRKEIFDRLRMLPNKRYIKERKKYVNYSLFDMGFNTIEFYCINKNSYRGYYTTIKINPSQLLDKNRLKLFKPNDYTDFEFMFNHTINQLDYDLPLLDCWKVRRVDYCSDIITENVEMYIQLGQRGNVPTVLTPQKYCTENNKLNLQGSVYYVCDSYKINIYNKQAEMKNSNDYSNEEICDAKNILRVEVQCMRNRTKYNKTKYNLKTKSLLEFLNTEIYQDTLTKAYSDTIGTGDYYKLNPAIALINESSYSTSHKNNLISVLQLVSKHRSVFQAKAYYIGKRDFNKCLKDLNVELSINPVTIPRRWNIDYLENPFCELNKKMI